MANRKNDVLIDSSSLFEVLKDESLRRNFTQWILNGRRRLLLSPLVVEEMLDHKDENLVVEQLTILGQLWRRLRPDFATWVRMPYECFAVEATVPLSSTPTATPSQRRTYDGHLLNSHSVTQFVRQPREQGRENSSIWKDELFKLDEKVRLDAEKKRTDGDQNFSAEKTRDFIKNYPGPKETSFLLEPIIKKVNGLSGGTTSAIQVVTERQRFPFLFTWTCMAEVTALGNTLSKEDGSEIAQKLRTNRSSWYDNGLAASASLCKILLTEDKSLRWKSGHLFTLGLIKFYPSGIGELL